MRKNIKIHLSKITTIRLTNQNRLIVENECKKLNISINNFVNYLIELFDSNNTVIKKEVSKWITPLI